MTRFEVFVKCFLLGWGIAMTLFLQPQKPLGYAVIEELNCEDLKHIDIAVAWVRASGLVQLEAGITGAIERGAKLRLVVGIDADNTSIEGLEGLLNIAKQGKEGQVRLGVRHNEAGPLFHPKLYAFRTDKETRAYIGSNNLTQAGLFRNDELSVRVVEARKGQLEEQIDATMNQFTDAKSNLNRVLDLDLLKELIEKGYIFKEARLLSVSRGKIRGQARKKPAFGYAYRKPPTPPKPAAVSVVPEVPEPIVKVSTPDWQAVYLRVRFARGTQTQLPVDVVAEMRRRLDLGDDDVLEVKSRKTGDVRPISPANARGGVNTYKFEAREADGEPLLVFHHVGDELFFEFLAADTPVGLAAMNLLENGFETDPPTTFATRGDRDRATWWRFE